MTYPISQKSRKSGSTLIVVMFIVALLATLIGVALDYTSNTARLTVRGRDLTTAQALADGAVEAAYMAWQQYMIPRQGSTFATAATAGFTSASDFDAITGPVVTALNTAAAGTGFTVKKLILRAVDQTDKPCSFQSDAYVTTGPLQDTPGWTARSNTYRVLAVVARSSTSVGEPLVTSVSRYFQQADAGLLQAMFFFQNDLELHPGPNMNIYGPVHTNANLFLCAGNGTTLKFFNNVSYAGAGAPDLAPKVPANFFQSADGQYVEGVTATQYAQEPGRWDAYYNPVYSSGARENQLSKVEKLDPLGLGSIALDPTNYNESGTHEIIERPYTTATGTPSYIAASTAYTDDLANHRLFTGAGLRVLINRKAVVGNQVHVYQPGTTPADSKEITPGGIGAPNIADQIIAAVTPSVGGDMTDIREGHKVNVNTVDVSKLVTPLNNYGAYNGVVYITDVTNTITTTDGTAAGNAKLGQMGDSDAIRLKKGGILPTSGLTIVSDGAIYVQGDYNTGSTYNALGTLIPSTQPDSDLRNDPTKPTYNGYVQKPAAVIGDAVMVLSNSWVDANGNQSPSQITGVRVASPTTMNAAIVTGQVLTDTNNDNLGSGGAHNLPRFLEDWSNKAFTYNGSMVELYPSQHFTAPWTTSTNVYSAPNRSWFFDYSYITRPPPGNLRATNYVRGRWARNQISGNE